MRLHWELMTNEGHGRKACANLQASFSASIRFVNLCITHPLNLRDNSHSDIKMPCSVDSSSLARESMILSWRNVPMAKKKTFPLVGTMLNSFRMLRSWTGFGVFAMVCSKSQYKRKWPRKSAISAADILCIFGGCWKTWS